MNITPIKTHILMPPHDDLFVAIRAAVPRIKEKSVLAVTSKVVSIGEGRCVAVSDAGDKDALIKREAELYLPRNPKAYNVMHTITQGLLAPAAGIDESNANGYYILLPKDPRRCAKRLHAWLRETYRIRQCGVIITDSRSVPLRRGVVGVSIAHYGFAPLQDYRGEKDLFGRELAIAQKNIADGLAAAAVVAMGEGSECTPLAVIEDLPYVVFTDRPSVQKKPFSSLEVPLKEDLYSPFLSSVKWKRGGKKHVV